MNVSINKNNETDPMIGSLIFDKYKISEKLGSGTFGSVYKASYENQLYAIKIEDIKTGQNLLETEAKVMSYLGGSALPLVKSFGKTDTQNILVMELMGYSLEYIFENFLERKMGVRCVCNIAYQMIEIAEFIHENHIIHRDIKPDNFVIGLNDKRKYIYLTDFGLCKKYRSAKTKMHYPWSQNKRLIGTARYASINALKGETQSRRDDLESIGYVLIYFLKGRLPWQGIKAKEKEERYRKILEKKMEISAEDLCEGFPREFANYINYTRRLKYDEDPDYNKFLKSSFISILKRDNNTLDCFYDWDPDTIIYTRKFIRPKNGYNINDIYTSINNESRTQIISNKNKNFKVMFDNLNFEKAHSTIISHSQNQTAPPIDINIKNKLIDKQYINFGNLNNNKKDNIFNNNNLVSSNNISMNNNANKSALYSALNPPSYGSIPPFSDFNNDSIQYDTKDSNKENNNSNENKKKINKCPDKCCCIF